MRRERDDESTVASFPVEGTPKASDRLLLLVMGDEIFEVHDLPTLGKVTFGRSSGADIQIRHASISRKHAELVLGPTIQLRDLDSLNGTRVGDTTLAPRTAVVVKAGEAMELGSVTLIVQQGGTKATKIDGVKRAGTGDLERATIPAPPMPMPLPTGMVAGAWLTRVTPVLTRVAAGDIHVLLLGETGVGKELLAELVHRQSNRADKAIVKLNCAAFPEQLLESELFGYEKGAFTGADRPKQGLLEVANGGTLFLDEVGEMPLTTQAKLLRVIEDGSFMRVGGLTARTADVRYVAATNRDLLVEVEHRRFRRDLLYRLNAFTLKIPPLRERTSEIEPLAREFVAQASRRADRVAPELSPDSLRCLLRYDWPGNVRELKNAIDRAVLLAEGDSIEIEHLPANVVAPSVDRGDPTSPKYETEPPPLTPAPRHRPEDHQLSAETVFDQRLPKDRRAELERELVDLEKQRIIDALAQCGGNQTRAAEILGISRRTLVSRLRDFDIPRPRKRE